jgi:hypothetical protein
MPLIWINAAGGKKESRSTKSSEPERDAVEHISQGHAIVYGLVNSNQP